MPETETDALLADADHVDQHPPRQRRHDAATSTPTRFARMKPGASFYNIGRGTTVDQPALIAALSNRQIAGAYLDVTDPEPLPPDHPLWRAPNCFITPTPAAGTTTSSSRSCEHFLRNLRRFEQGEPLRRTA